MRLSQTSDAYYSLCKVFLTIHLDIFHVLNLQQNTDTISSQADHTRLAFEEVYGRINGVERAHEQIRHVTDKLTSQINEVAKAMENT